MKKNLLIMACLLFSLVVSAQQSGIKFFHGSWDEALAKAKAENKLIFIDFYTQWCGPCKLMARDVFVTQAVGDFYNSNFVCCKIDAETPEGAPLAKKYGVVNFPTYVFVNPDNEELKHLSTSRQSEATFLFTGQSAVSTDKNSVYLNQQNQNGSEDPEFMFNYMYFKASKGERAVADRYLEKLLAQPGYQLSNPRVWDYFTTFIRDKKSPLTAELVANTAKYAKLYGQEEVDNMLFELFKFARSEGELQSVSDFAGKDYLVHKCRLEASLASKDYAQAQSIADEMMANPGPRVADFCHDLRFILRLPNDKSRSTVSLDPALLNIYIDLYRFAAYNAPDRTNGEAHFYYALLMEYLIQNNLPQIERIKEQPDFGTPNYSMRPVDLARKPKRK